MYVQYVCTMYYRPLTARNMYLDTMSSFSDPFLGVPNLTPRDLGFRAESDQKCSGGCQSAQNLIIEHCYVCGHPTGIPILISGTF